MIGNYAIIFKHVIKSRNSGIIKANPKLFLQFSRFFKVSHLQTVYNIAAVSDSRCFVKSFMRIPKLRLKGVDFVT